MAWCCASGDVWKKLRWSCSLLQYSSICHGVDHVSLRISLSVCFLTNLLEGCVAWCFRRCRVVGSKVFTLSELKLLACQRTNISLPGRTRVFLLKQVANLWWYPVNCSVARSERNCCHHSIFLGDSEDFALLRCWVAVAGTRTKFRIFPGSKRSSGWLWKASARCSLFGLTCSSFTNNHKTSGHGSQMQFPLFYVYIFSFKLPLRPAWLLLDPGHFACHIPSRTFRPSRRPASNALPSCLWQVKQTGDVSDLHSAIRGGL